jgi:ribosomal protein S18 acetylase RimI-like enzyme
VENLLRKNSSKIINDRVSSPDTVIRAAHPCDAELLVELGKRAFYEAFSGQTAPDDMAAYIRTTFCTGSIAEQLRNNHTLYFIIEVQTDPLGYAYLYPSPIPDCVKDPDAIQLIRFYLLKKYYGCGVGNVLMRHCLNAARARGYRSVWLSSWDLNDRANVFYKKWQFEIVGRQTFKVGSDIQNDHILMRKI